MLTPAFELSQDEKFVYIYIKTPYIKISNVEFFIEGCQFKFYVKPYFLRLNLPGKVVENGEESASYDVEKGLFTVKLPKMEPGYHFPDLDMLTKLLAPSGQYSISSPIIEVISDKTSSNKKEEEEEEENWEWEQDLHDEKREHDPGPSGVKYGFASKRAGVFYRLQDNLKEIVENPNPDELSYHERCIARVAAEQAKFDPDHYLADYFDSERIKEVITYTVKRSEDLLTDKEKNKLRRLPNKEYLLDNKEEKSACLSLVDILFAYAYNHRTTLGENTVESAWTISTISPTLSWFERFTSLQDVLEACCRRSLSYPLYRHWELSCKVIEDVKNIFNAGRRKILKCLLEIHELFNCCDPRYLLNELYITDYCIWIQKVTEKKLNSLTKKLAKATISKEDVGFELKELELAALIVCNEESSDESSNEPSSSDDSRSASEDETSSDESSNGENVEGASASEVSNNTSVFGGNLCEEDSNMDKQETSGDNERTNNIEILPSLLFEKKRTKLLVEVIDDDEDENENLNCVACHNTDIQRSCVDKDVDVKEPELEQTELSEKIHDLSLN